MVQSPVPAIPVQQAKAELFRTLAHPARIRILELLFDGPRPVHELAAQIDIETSNLSQQLAVLRRANLVVSQRIDGQVIYELSADDVALLMKVARQLLESVLSDQQQLLAAVRDEA